MAPDPEADTRGVEPLTFTELQRERYDVDGCQPHATCTTTFGQRQRVVATIDKLRAKVHEQAHNEQVIRVLQQQNVDALARIDAEVALRRAQDNTIASLSDRAEDAERGWKDMTELYERGCERERAEVAKRREAERALREVWVMEHQARTEVQRLEAVVTAMDAQLAEHIDTLVDTRAEVQRLREKVKLGNEALYAASQYARLRAALERIAHPLMQRRGDDESGVWESVENAQAIAAAALDREGEEDGAS